MKIAITAQGQDLDSLVDPRFGRAKWFIVVDTDTGEFEAVNNTQNVNAAQGAGIQAGQIVAQHGVEALLTGHCGPNAFHTLQAAGVKAYVGVDGKVGEAVEKFKTEELKSAEAADVQGHWT